MLQHLIGAVILQEMSNQEPKYICNPHKWVDLYADQLFSFALKRVNKRELAEDLVHDAFVAALKNVTQFKGESSELTWLYSILRNKIIDSYRSKEKKMASKFYNIDEASGYDKFFYVEGDKRGRWQSNQSVNLVYEAADQSFEREEFMMVLKLCMGNLPFKWSEVFRMKTIEEMDTKEICKELTITPSNLWVIIHRAKLQLKECMEKNWQK